MSFNLLAYLRLWLGGTGIAEAELVAKLKELVLLYPDLRTRIDALTTWLSGVLAPTHDVAAMKDVLWGIASDIVHGTAGTDPGSWEGSV